MHLRSSLVQNPKFQRLSLVQAIIFAAIFTQVGFAQENTEQIETITIVGSEEAARNVAGTATVITSEQLEVYEYTDIHKILSSVPGVNFRPEEGYGLRPNISIRGTYADRSGKITLMEDGVLIAPGPYSASSAYYFPTVGRLAGVEVLKGAAAITQGPYTIGGAINLLSTPIPEEQSGFFNQEFGQDGTQRTHATYGNSSENFGFLLEAHLWESDGFDTIQDESGDTGFEKEDYVAKFRLNSDRDAAIYQELNFKYQWSDESSDQTYVGLADASFKRDPHERYGLTKYDNMDNEHETLAINYGVELGQFEFDATYYQNDFARDWFKVDKIDNKKLYGLGNGINNIIGAANGGSLAALSILNGDNDTPVEVKLKHNNREYESDGLDLRLNWSNDLHLVTVGYRDTEDSEDRFQFYEYSQWSGGKMGALTVGSPPGYSSNNRLTEADANAFYIQDVITLDNLTLNIGYRSEDWSITQERYIDSARSAINTEKGYPKTLASDNASLFGLGAVYDFSDEISFYAGFNEGFTPTSGGADPEEAENTEVGVRYASGATYIDVGYFATDYENMFGSCTASGGAVGDCEIGDSFNAGEADISGFEILGRHVFESGNLTFPVSLSYTATDTEFRNTFSSSFWGDVTSGDDIPDLPDSQLALSVGVNSGNGWSGNLTFYSFGDTCSVASCAAGTKIDSHSEVDIVVRREISENIDAYLTVMNLTDEEDIVARSPKNGARAQFPRAALVGIRWRF